MSVRTLASTVVAVQMTGHSTSSSTSSPLTTTNTLTPPVPQHVNDQSNTPNRNDQVAATVSAPSSGITTNPLVIQKVSLDIPLMSSEQLYPTPSMSDNLPYEVEFDLRLVGCELIQTGGRLLKLPQTAMATAQVLFHRYFYIKSFVKNQMETYAMASLFLSSKTQECPRRIRDVMNVFHHLKQVRTGKIIKPMQIDENYNLLKNQIIKAERRMLKELGFCVHVKHPHKIIFIYLQAMECNQTNLSQKAWNYMNDSLRTDIFLRYRPEIIACACIYLSARELQIPLPDNPPWYLIFEADEESIRNICVRILHLYTHKTKTQEELESIVNECRKNLEQERLKAKETAAAAAAAAVVAATTNSPRPEHVLPSADAKPAVVEMIPKTELSSMEKIKSFEKTKSISASVLSATTQNGGSKSASSYVIKKHSTQSNTPPQPPANYYNGNGSAVPANGALPPYHHPYHHHQYPHHSSTHMTRHLSFNNYYSNHPGYVPPQQPPSHQHPDLPPNPIYMNGAESYHNSYMNENSYYQAGLKKNKSASYLIDYNEKEYEEYYQKRSSSRRIDHEIKPRSNRNRSYSRSRSRSFSPKRKHVARRSPTRSRSRGDSLEIDTIAERDTRSSSSSNKHKKKKSHHRSRSGSKGHETTSSSSKHGKSANSSGVKSSKDKDKDKERVKDKERGEHRSSHSKESHHHHRHHHKSKSSKD